MALFGTCSFLGAAVGVVLALSVEGDTDWETVFILQFIAAFCVAALALLRVGWPLAAAWLLMLTGTAGTTILVFTGRSTGFDDIAIMIFGILTIAASVLFDARNFVVAQLLIIASLAGILMVELSRSSVTGLERGAIVSDAGFSVLIVTVTGISSHFLVSSLRTSVAHEEEHKVALRRANEELERRNAELERFAYTISHELKSPLVTIGGFLPYLRKNARSGELEAFESDLGWIERAHAQMARLLSELLDLCRLGFLPKEAEEVPFAEIVEQARFASQNVLREKGLRIEILGELPVVRGDRERLVEVMQNLLENASRFTRQTPEPKVEVGVRSDGDEAVVFVRDNGVGIPPAHHEAVFELFRKLDPGDPGTGVGLAIVRRIIELHDGRIWVESQGDGQGATFCISLPWTQMRPKSRRDGARPPRRYPPD